MKHWLNNVNVGFENGSNPKSDLWVLNYVRVGKNRAASGDQGGTFMSPCDRWETSLKAYICQSYGSFGSFSSTFVGGLQELGSRGLMMCWETDSSCMREVCSWFGFSTWFHLFL